MRSLKLKNIPFLAYGDLPLLKKAFLSGCCDYIRTPLSSDELYFRILKNTASHSHVYQWEDLVITCRYIQKGVRKVSLTYQQFLILQLLLSHKNVPVPRQSFQYLLWGAVKQGSRAVDMHIASIRKKLVQLNSDNRIKTITGLGYLIEDHACG